MAMYMSQRVCTVVCLGEVTAECTVVMIFRARLVCELNSVTDAPE